MKIRTAIKTDLFANEHHRKKIDKLGDPLAEIPSAAIRWPNPFDSSTSTRTTSEQLNAAAAAR